MNKPPAKPYHGKKTWREKLQDDKGLPKVGPIDGRMAVGLSKGTMVIPAAREVDALMRCVPRGKLTTIDELRAALAAKHKVDVACPITTGIFAWMSAHTADEASTAGEAEITPYWRTLKAKGEINPKYPGGLAAVTARLEAEGHVVFQKGKRAFVRDYEKALARRLRSKPKALDPERGRRLKVLALAGPSIFNAADESARSIHSTVHPADFHGSFVI